MLSTEFMGGVTVQPDDLAAMQAGDYVLHARAGRLNRVPVEKTRLPRDPQGHVQRLCLVQAPNGTIYAAQHTLLHRSTDGGATWEHLERDPSVCAGWRLQFDSDGTMLNVGPAGPGQPPVVWASPDEGATWQQRGRIDTGTPDVLSLGFSMTRLEDGTLLLPVLVGADRVGNRAAAEAAPAVGRLYRSPGRRPHVAGVRSARRVVLRGQRLSAANRPAGRSDALPAPPPPRRPGRSAGADRRQRGGRR